MTRVLRNRIIKDANSDIDNHLSNHIQSSNNVHLKNHMNKLSPIVHDSSLVRDLSMLQRSQSLRDPSTSPPLWHSPIIPDLFSKDGDRVEYGGRSLENIEVSDIKPGSKHIASPKSSIKGNSKRRGLKGTTKEEYNIKVVPKIVSRQLSEIPWDNDEVVTSNKLPNRVKRHKSRRVKREPVYTASRNIGAQDQRCMASTASVKEKKCHIHDMEDAEDELDDLNVSRTGQSRCKIPVSWSMIHHRGKSFLDMAGRSFSCGLSDPRLRKEGQPCQGRDGSDFLEESDHSSSCSKSNSEALPLLDESASQGTSDNVAWAHDYSGDLGIIADGLLKCNTKSKIASKTRSIDKLRWEHCSRHQNLTQKYMPQKFRDLIGQNLVAQAMLNAIARRKVGLLYVFHGTHGTGKTSAARIFARALNCQSEEHPKPCGYCSSCKAYNMGRSRNIEVGPAGNFDFESIPKQSSQQRVFIFDDCDTFSSDSWIAVSKFIDRAPKCVVFILICSSLDGLPHTIVSRCQKFFFPKLKDADMIYALQCIAKKEGLEIDKDALKLIISRSDGSLRDAEMTLEQLSLLGQRISVNLVQELVGMICDDKLVDLLDLALSANTKKTVKNLREIVESGVEPLALMSQLATVITDILAGSYDFKKGKRNRKFFQCHALSDEGMEKLRQALKILSDAEKQLRRSSDKLTWLTAALLQLASDQQYTLPTTPTKDVCSNQIQFTQNDRTGADKNCSSDCVKVLNVGSAGVSKISISRKPLETSAIGHVTTGNQDKRSAEIENIWLKVLENIENSCIKEFMCEGKLISVNYGPAPTVQLMFTSPQTKSKAEKYRACILQAFDSVIGSPVTLEIRCKSRKIGAIGAHTPLTLRTSFNESNEVNINPDSLVHRIGYIGSSRNTSENWRHSKMTENAELGASLREQEFNGHFVTTSATERGGFVAQNQCKRMMRRRASLPDVIQQDQRSARRRARAKCKAVSIAEKLEEENMSLESKSRTILCWKASRSIRRKFAHSRNRTCRPHTLLKLVSCGKCLNFNLSR